MKISILLKLIYRFNAIPIKLPMVFFTELEQRNCKFCTETQKTTNHQCNLEKADQSWRNQPSWLQIILQSYSHQDSMVLAKNRNIDQWNKTERPEIYPYIYGNNIFHKGGKNILWRKYSFFNKWYWENGTVICKRMKSEHILTPYTKINSK